MESMKVSVISNSNIALTKYWGRKNQKTGTPYNSSTSVTLDEMFTHTTIEFDPSFKQDRFLLDGKEYCPGTQECKEMQQQLDYIRKLAKSKLKAKIISKNNFPTAAGFASSASGNSALAFAAAKALGLNLNTKELSKLTKMVSGSAARSLIGGFAVWHKGKRADAKDSFAEAIADENHWPEFRLLACVITRQEKKVKSRTGMAQSVATSPLFKAWYTQGEKDSARMIKLIKEKNFSEIGKLAQRNCLLMHSCMLTTIPAIVYFESGTIEVIHKILQMQQEDKEVYFTMDAGPQVKVLCLEKDAAMVKGVLEKMSAVQQVYVCKPGKGTRQTDKHLF